MVYLVFLRCKLLLYFKNLWLSVSLSTSYLFVSLSIKYKQEVMTRSKGILVPDKPVISRRFIIGVKLHVNFSSRVHARVAWSESRSD